MFTSERFLARVGKLRKSDRAEPMDRQITAIRKVFVDMNRHLPTGLVEGLLDHFTMNLAEGSGDSPFDRCRELADLIDVLHEEYDTENDPLNDWAAIGDAISGQASDLDMEFVTYVMKLTVDHNAV
jgi:hypothetical protein